MTPHQYLINFRILEAKQLLKTEKSIIEIADLCGFSDAKSFGRCFRNKQGFPQRNSGKSGSNLKIGFG